MTQLEQFRSLVCSTAGKLPDKKYLDFAFTVKPLWVSPAKPGAYLYLVIFDQLDIQNQLPETERCMFSLTANVSNQRQ